MPFSAVPSTQLLGDWDTFFDNADTTNCAVTSCTLKIQGCGAAYTPGNQAVAGTTPFGITATKNVNGGYIETVCVSCSNTLQTIDYDNFKITQTHCAVAITPKTVPPDPMMTYSTAPSSQIVGDWTTYFTNADTTYCPITSCSLKNAGCGGAFSGAQLSIPSAASPWSVSANKNVVAGYNEKTCVECTNGDQIATLDNVEITQTRDCSTSLAL